MDLCNTICREILLTEAFAQVSFVIGKNSHCIKLTFIHESFGGRNTREIGNRRLLRPLRKCFFALDPSLSLSIGNPEVSI
jgi:hypothetical protein